MQTIKAPARIGWIGLGKMGLPICRRLRDAGFTVTALCRNPAAEVAATADGFAIARSIAETAEGAEAVFSGISDDKALFDIVFAAGGLKDRLTPKQIYVDISTVSPDASARVAKALSPLGCAYLRSPVSGSTVVAAQGALTAMVSGPADAFGGLADVFAAFTKKAFLVGSGEQALTLKLAINAMVGATSALMGEALALARKGGLDIHTVMEVVSSSVMASPLVLYKRATIENGDYAPAFGASQMLKDFDLIAEAANATSCDVPLLMGVRETYRAAIARGLGDKDFFVLTAQDASVVK